MKMIRFRTSASLFIGVALFGAPLVTFAGNDRINSFVSHIVIHTDGSADVQEEIVYNFGNVAQHGIYREIPLVFTTSDSSANTQVDISSISVSDGHGVSRQTSYDKGGNMVTLKIGDSDKVVSGSQLYVIRYRLWGAMTPTLLEDRFVWDITGHEWKVPIDRTRVDIVLPKPLSRDAFSYACYSGNLGSNKVCAEPKFMTLATSSLVQSLRFEEDNFGRQQGISLQFRFRKGIIFYTPAENERGLFSTSSNAQIIKWWKRPFIDLSLAFPFFVFAGLYSNYISQQKLKKKKSPKKNITQSSGELMLSMRSTYILAGILISGLSVFLPAWNLGIFCSGLVIFCFAFMYSSER